MWSYNSGFRIEDADGITHNATNTRGEVCDYLGIDFDPDVLPDNIHYVVQSSVQKLIVDEYITLYNGSEIGLQKFLVDCISQKLKFVGV